MKKKIILCVVFVFGICAIGFSQQEFWFTAGGSLGNNFIIEESDFENFYVGSPGMNLSLYALGEKNMGLFFNFGILFPVIYSDKKNYDPSVQLDFILLGIGFGYNINENAKLHFGIGPNLNYFAMVYNENDNTKIADYIIGLGIGGDIGIKYNLNNSLCLNIGTTLAWNFAVFNETLIEISGDDGWRHIKTVRSGFGNINSIITIKPYMAIGYHFKNN
jgi:hypothetical protein